MPDKELIKKNFKKSLLTYDNNAIVQKTMAQKLISKLNKKEFKNILEIGSYSGLLTKKATEELNFETYLALDIIDSFDLIKNISPKIEFQKIDIENFKTDKKFDLIIANASLQWCNDFNNTIKKLKSYLSLNGILAISVFTKENLYEIKETFNIGLNYLSDEDIKKIFSKNAKITQEKEILQFKTSKDILRHLKYTGVNSIAKTNFTISQIKEKLKALDENYQNKLTYTPLYIIDAKD